MFSLIISRKCAFAQILVLLLYITLFLQLV